MSKSVMKDFIDILKLKLETTSLIYTISEQELLRQEKKQKEKFAEKVLEFYHNNLFTIQLKKEEAKEIIKLYKTKL